MTLLVLVGFAKYKVDTVIYLRNYHVNLVGVRALGGLGFSRFFWASRLAFTRFIEGFFVYRA